MRRDIEAAPKDGNVIILEDDTCGTYELGHWSTEQMAWVGEDEKVLPDQSDALASAAACRRRKKKRLSKTRALQRSISPS